MVASKVQVEQAILFFAKLFGQEDSFRALMGAYSGLPRIVEMIVYEMFLHEFNPIHSTGVQFEQYKLIHEYATELKMNGFVSHEQKNEFYSNIGKYRNAKSEINKHTPKNENTTESNNIDATLPKTVTILQVGNTKNDETYIDGVYYDKNTAIKNARERINNGEIITTATYSVK